ncbi:MAG: replicative DNA helicase [Gemmataceae bacterium]|nr:replicative DNA helicase [Gemmataceae bacterium]
MYPDPSVADRLPPHNRDAERSLLGSMLRDNQVIPEAVNLVRAEHFYVFGHQKIFEAITKLNDDDGKPADIVTVAEWLSQAKLMDDVGGHGYLVELFDAAPSAAHYRQYAEIIREKAIVRNLIHACTDLQAEAYNQTQKPKELLDSAERRILEIAEMGITGNTVTLHDALQEAFQRLDQKKLPGHEFSGIKTGFMDLDDLTAGFQKNELIIIAARPSVGKTAFALNIARHVVVEDGLPVLFVSLEQAKVEIADRLLCCQGRVDSHRMRRGHLNSDEVSRMMEASELLGGGAKLFIDDTPGQNMLRIAANARRLKKREDIRLVMIDYLQLIDPDDRRESRQEQVSGISRRLKFLARELKLPVVALAQVNRSSEDRQDHRPRLSDLRESGAIEQDADTVIMLHRPDSAPGQNEGLIEVNVAKQRNGPTGEKSLIYVKEYMRFENFAVEHSSSFGGI